jgi:hypothetical protein
MNTRVTKVVAILIVLFDAPLAIYFAHHATGKPADSDTAADETAINEVVAGFSDSRNSQDVRAMWVSLADAVQWVNWRQSRPAAKSLKTSK